jgi:CheY-like chemotaxis protein
MPKPRAWREMDWLAPVDPDAEGTVRSALGPMLLIISPTMLALALVVSLIVDDEELVRRTARRMLESKGYRIVEASSGSRAVELLGSEDSIALALIDLTMPEMDGEETLSALRVHAPDLPAVFMSGHSNEAIGRRVAGKRRTSHSKKPFRMPALSQAVAELLFESGASA